MSLMRRVRDLTVATLNDRLENTQDPIRVIDSFLREIADAIQETEALYRQASAHTASLRSQYMQADALARKRDSQAMIAMKAGEEMIARAAIAEKIAEEEKRDSYRALYEQSQQSLNELETQLAELRRNYQEVYNKRQYYAAKLETLRLQQQMYERTQNSQMRGDRWFQRLEEKISDMELETRALMELRSTADNILPRVGDKIELALAELKRKLEKGNEAK